MALKPLQLIPAIHRTTHTIGLSIARAIELDVTQAEAHILDHLASHGACTVGALHRAFAHRRSTLTSVLDRLAGRRLIARTASARDRRTFEIALTSRGRTKAARVHRALAQIEARALARLARQDVERFIAVLERLDSAMKKDVTRVQARAARLVGRGRRT
jgi:DNA-binding MarR family transcriptional regulator